MIILKSNAKFYFTIIIIDYQLATFLFMAQTHYFRSFKVWSCFHSLIDKLCKD